MIPSPLGRIDLHQLTWNAHGIFSAQVVGIGKALRYTEHHAVACGWERFLSHIRPATGANLSAAGRDLENRMNLAVRGRVHGPSTGARDRFDPQRGEGFDDRDRS